MLCRAPSWRSTSSSEALKYLVPLDNVLLSQLGRVISWCRQEFTWTTKIVTTRCGSRSSVMNLVRRAVSDRLLPHVVCSYALLTMSSFAFDRMSSGNRCRLRPSPATGLVGMQENAFLSDFFGCVGFLPLTDERCNDSVHLVVLPPVKTRSLGIPSNNEYGRTLGAMCRRSLAVIG